MWKAIVAEGAITNSETITKSVKWLKQLNVPFWLPVTGSSMRPTLLDGDFVLIKPLAAETLPKSGDLILFVYEDVPVVHRIIDGRGTLFFESGDFSRDIATIERGDIIGVVERVKRSKTVFKPSKRSLRWRWKRFLLRLGGRNEIQRGKCSSTHVGQRCSPEGRSTANG